MAWIMKPRYIFLLAVIITLLTPASASAITPLQYGDLNSLFNYKFDQQANQPVILLPEKPKDPEPVKAEKPKPVVYVVVSGDNLTKIGSEHNVEWQRLWAKNKQLKHPDVLQIGDKITIPLPDEKLSREIPPSVSLPAVTPGVEPLRTVKAPERVAVSYGGSNTYSYGYCTWYVKNRRGASLPNGLGNANTWYSRAAGMGMAVGSTPRAGAVGTTTRGALGHVVYVESVNGDGTINIWEMNAPTWGKATYRTASASEFVYIY